MYVFPKRFSYCSKGDGPSGISLELGIVFHCATSLKRILEETTLTLNTLTADLRDFAALEHLQHAAWDIAGQKPCSLCSTSTSTVGLGYLYIAEALKKTLNALYVPRTLLRYSSEPPCWIGGCPANERAVFNS